jgi:hypothetical protein
MVRSDSGKPARDTRSNRVGRELALLRRRNAEQLAQARERERRVDEALRDYAAATTRIASADSAHEAKVRRLRDRIDKLTTLHAEALEQDVRAQASAVRQISDSGRTVRDLAELLDLSQRAVGRLLERSRDFNKPSEVSGAAAPTRMTSDGSSTQEHVSPRPRDAGSAGPGSARGAGDGAGHAQGGPHDAGAAGAAAPVWALDGAGDDPG